MIAAVVSTRLEQLYEGRRLILPMIDGGDLRAIQRGVLHALGLSWLTSAI
jgi:hypothetical protein